LFGERKKISGCPTNNTALHSMNGNDYNIRNLNMSIVKDLKIFDPKSNRPIDIMDTRKIYETFSQLCSCSKNIGKRQLGDV
jgi:hypothetical protein